jgi:cobalt-zinc-cadmium efflux system protein
MEHNHSGHSIDPKKHFKIKIAFLLTLIFAFVEFTTGQIFNSLALIADAGHMITDSIALFIATIAIYLAAKPATKKYTFGISKVEIAAAIINVILITFVIFDIGYEAYNRLDNNITIDATGVIFIATIGLFVNIAVFFMLHLGHENLNTKAAKLHVIGDLIGSIAAIISGIIIYFFNLVIFDPIMSAIVCVILLKMTYDLSKTILVTILDAVPDGICLEEIENEILNLHDKILSIHDIHIWKSSDKEISLTAHIDMKCLNNWNEILYSINAKLEEHEIMHVTLQPELLID